MRTTSPFFTIPASIVIGSVKGGYTGVSNAFGGFDKPFTRDTFSLGDMGD